MSFFVNLFGGSSSLSIASLQPNPHEKWVKTYGQQEFTRYSQCFQTQYTPGTNGYLVANKTKQSTGASQETLQKVIQISLEDFQGWGKTTWFVHNDKQYVAAIQETQLRCWQVVQKIHPLDENLKSETTVYKVMDLATGHFFALKMVKGSKASSWLAKEYEILKELNQQKVWGIAKKPEAYLEVTFLHKRKEVSGKDLLARTHMLFTPFYEADFLTFLTNKPEGYKTLEQRLYQSAQLFAGLAFMKALGWGHLDIKADNYLAQPNEKGYLDLFLADFVGTVKKSDGFKSANHIQTSSLAYTTEADLKELSQLRKQELIEEVVLHAQKMDVFALGLLLYGIFANKTAYPYPQGMEYFPDVTKSDFGALKVKVDQKLYELIISMINSDPSQRPTMQDAYLSFQKYLCDSHRELYDSILNLCRKNEYVNGFDSTLAESSSSSSSSTTHTEFKRSQEKQE